jgi:RNA ligase (TIGR02306 family)
MTERKLASIQRVNELRPINGADLIELAIINGWQVVVAKNVGHQVGDLVVYCEIDSFLPIRDEFEFLRKSSYKKLKGGTEGFRLKTIKLKGEISQGLVLPKSVLTASLAEIGQLEEDLDVTEVLGIVKYDPPLPAELGGVAKGNFPSFIPKTSEDRVQNIAKKYSGLGLQSKHKFYATEKLDGSSATYYVRDGQFGVCQRNYELEDPGEFVPGMEMCDDGIKRPKKQNLFWKVANELDLERKLIATGLNIAVQGELIGEGIRENRYGITGQELRVFNVFMIDDQSYAGPSQLCEFVSSVLEIQTVPIIDVEFLLPETIEELLKVADGKSELNNTVNREGLVIRSHDSSISFKVISNKFLIENEE